jgi:cell division protein FtsA
VPLDLANICVSSLASALAVLTTEQQQLGAVVIDMGGGTTDYIAYREGTVQHSGVIAVGGDHITNDIATGLKIPMNLAEQLKLEHGSVEWPVPEETINLKREIGLPDRPVSKEQLCHVMHLRVAETLSLIKKELEEQGLLEYLGAGVYITGGGAKLRGLEALATQVFGLPVHLGHSQTINGPTAAIESPEFSTAIGIVRYAVGSRRDEHRPPSPFCKINQGFQQLVAKVRALM